MPPTIKYTPQQKQVTFQNLNTITASVIVKAVAELRHNNMNGGSTPLQSILPPGWYSGDCPAHHNRGHLIGNNLGGPGNDSNNLVTLVSGTNHPIMYEYEFLVKKYVESNTLKQPYSYIVECNYDAVHYTLTSGFPVPGAAGNPFCLFPAPVALFVSLLDKDDNNITLQNLLENYQSTYNQVKLTAVDDMQMINKKLGILNGVFKSYGSNRHFTSNCWSVTHDSKLLLNDAKLYAQSLGYNV